MNIMRYKIRSFIGLFILGLNLFVFVHAEQITFSEGDQKYNIDMDKFQNYWLEKVNTVRSDLGINEYNLSQDLHTVAQSRSDYSKSIGDISHKKYGSKAYYDYNLIQKYAESFGLVFLKEGTKVVENIGRGYVNCGKEIDNDGVIDCTDQIMKASEETWRFYIKEKGKSYAPHYKSMISSWYTQAGFGISVNPTTKKYYFTAYYSVPTKQLASNLPLRPRLLRKKTLTLSHLGESRRIAERN